MDTLNSALHIGSYPVKASDADEIGVTYANYIMNNVLPRVERETHLKTIGCWPLHGRPYSDRSLLRGASSEGPEILAGARAAGGRAAACFQRQPVQVGSQAARTLSLADGRRSVPFQDQDRPGGTMAITWSDKDTANPWARFLTGAKHTGGKPGSRVMESEVLAPKVHDFAWIKGDAAMGTAECRIARREGKLSYIDATSIIARSQRHLSQ